jgi:outer membrane receptor protein involved in Fe transport
MSTVTVPDIEVTANRVTSIPVTLRPGKELQEKVRVTAQSEVVNQDSTTVETKITSEFIDALPILGRNYQDVLTLAPGVSDVDGDGNPNIHGARDVDVATLVDGVSTVDPVTGQVGQQLNINSIQEIEVKTAGASAEFGRAQGGFVTLVTKSGGNDFEGSFRIDYRSNIFDGDGAGIDDPTLHGGLGEIGLRDLDFQTVYPQLTVSGPIVKDKAWYFVAAEYRQEETPVNALTQAFVRTHEETRLFGKASWDISTNHKLVFTATFDPQRDDNLGLDSFTSIESGFTSWEGGRSLVLRETAVFSPNVFLDTIIQDFVSSPYIEPTINPDTNGNGILYVDRNRNSFIDATERDPGEDNDRDNQYDAFEDQDRDGNLDLGEDLDNDGRLTQEARNGVGGGCEGVGREDLDCDGRLDKITEDTNSNGIMDAGEDRDRDGNFDITNEDRNNNNILDDKEFLQGANNDIIPDEGGNFGNYYPYGRQVPVGRDRDYSQDQRTLRTTGPYLMDFDGERGRQTLRQDLTIFVPDWHGQHDLKTGYKIEREHYDQTTVQRPFVLPELSPPSSNQFLPTVGVILPAENSVDNEATALTSAIYVQDTFKPLPNLTLNLGLRFERETTDSFGYTQFDPAQERQIFNHLSALYGNEQKGPDSIIGNNDGIVQNGFCSDPLFSSNSHLGPICDTGQFNPTMIDILDTLKTAAISRLTQHHISTTLVANNLVTLFPEAKMTVGTCPDCEVIIDRDILRQHGAVFQEEEAFRLTNNNLAPRIAVSWDPWADSKTKITASWSRFYDKLFLNSIIPEEGPDQIARYYRTDADGITGSGIPNNGIGAAISKAPPSSAQVDRGLQTPFTDEWSIGFERELAPEISLRLSYISRKARLGLQDRDINHEVRFTDDGEYQDTLGRLSFGGGSQLGTRVGNNVPDLYAYNFFFNQIFRFGNYNTSEYDGIEVQVTKRLSRKWQMDASYTYGRAQGFAESFDAELGDDPATTPYEYGYLDYDQRHIVRFNGTTFLPGDWTVGGILAWSSGLPYSAITQVFDLNSFDYGQNRTLFGRVVPGNQGAVFVPERRNSRRNDPILNINLQATKSFVIGRFNSKLFLAVDNVLNTDNLDVTAYVPDNPNRDANLQLIAERDFGRRYSVGFQFEF